MTTFAHTESGQAIDPMAFPSESAYLANFNPHITASWQVTQVPDGTEQGATLVNGTWTNPTPPAPAVPQPQPLSQLGFILLCQEAGGMTDAQLVACKADPTFTALWIKFDAAQTIDQANPLVQQGLTALAAAGYIPNGATAVNAAWPKG